MNKILKLSKNEYYEVLDNDGKICDYCSFCGNLGNCWLACNGYHCDIDNKKFIYRRILDPYNRFYTDTLLKNILDIVKTTVVCNAISEEEKDMIIYVITSYINSDDKTSLLKDGRFLCNKTFSLRLYNFLSGIKSDDTDEINKLNECISFAKDMLIFQLKTCTNEDEIKYFKLNGFIDDNNNLILPWMK